jgi:hypothetical protein
MDIDAWNPASASPLALLSTQPHWTMNPVLDGKTFLAEYRCPDSFVEKSVHATPDYVANRVNIWWGKQPVRGVPPTHIFQQQVKPSTHEQGILIIKGDHVGKYARRIYTKYDKQRKHKQEPWMRVMTFRDWGTADESIIDENIIVDADDCTSAQIMSSKWNDVVKEKKRLTRMKREQPPKKRRTDKLS